MKKLILLLLLIPFCSSARAQDTGSFMQTISFEEDDYNYTRNLYFFVPEDYDPEISYKLVVGFRGGPHTNAGQFRDQLTFLSDSIGAIIMCPENEDHFWIDEGETHQLFDYSVDTTMSQYNIDEDYIYLTGLSYGGRHAVIASMDTDDGDIPSLRGVIPFAAGSDSHLQPNYDSTSEFPPACICIGLNDSDNFQNVANTLHNDIEYNGGASYLNEIEGVGHTVAFDTYPEEMMECIQFIEDYYEVIEIHESDLFEDEIDVRIYPNPCSSYIKIEYYFEMDVNEIYITDASGRVELKLNKKEFKIDLSEVSEGVKTITIKSNMGIFQEKLVVVK